jgi:hypothetical protein
MTPAQLARASGAPLKWIHNARRILRRPPAHDQREARWLGVVHELHATLGGALAPAARVADEVLAAPAGQRELRVALGDDGRFELVIDLWHDRSVHLARLSHALVRPPPDRRGRPSKAVTRRRSASARAAEYGIDVARLRAGLSRTAEERLARLDENVAFLAAGRASLAARRASTAR